MAIVEQRYQGQCWGLRVVYYPEPRFVRHSQSHFEAWLPPSDVHRDEMWCAWFADVVMAVVMAVAMDILTSTELSITMAIYMQR